MLFFIQILSYADSASARRLSPDEEENIRIYKSNSPGVVNISTIALSYDTLFRAVPTESGSGSGFFINKQGFILTNFHVIEGAKKLVVTTSDNKQYTATIKGIDPNNDLALIKINAKLDHIVVMDFADSNQLEVGQKVLALGNPFGLKQTLTTGIISALGRSIEARNGRKIEGMIQTDAAINPGNSGGPLLDNEGKVLGINTSIVGSTNAGIGFAIPSNTAVRIIADLIEYGYVIRPWLGVETLPTTMLQRFGLAEVPIGMLILNRIQGGPAERAGLRGANKQVNIGNYLIPWGGDIITHVDGKAVTSFEELAERVESFKPGDEISLQIVRGDQPLIVKLLLSARPRP